MRRTGVRYEKRSWEAGRLLIGVDEAGRGPLAGPVVAAAVAFPIGCRRSSLVRDSKTLSEGQRDSAARWIRAKASAIGVGCASVREIDRFNIRRATALAMRRAVDRAVGGRFDPSQATILIDGLAMPELGLPHEALVDGDAISLTISAAGIIAKTVRDLLMGRLAGRHPVYDWASNRGYGTEAHRRAIDDHGPTRHHRQSFMPVAQLGLGL
ncbi:MAG: ribonuclease HII [Gemmatimonadetes bacterium]|nr:ribonuclease HII [Gemmatimonadota bacterium]